MMDAAEHNLAETPPNMAAIPADELARMTDDIVAAMKTVYDPEIPVDIYELGLVYKVDIDDDRNVAIEMTLTAPGCPVAVPSCGLWCAWRPSWPAPCVLP